MTTFYKVDYRWTGSFANNWCRLYAKVSEIQAESKPENQYYESNWAWNSEGIAYFDTLEDANAWIEREYSYEVQQ